MNENVKSKGIYNLSPGYISGVSVIKGGDQQNIAWNQHLSIVDVRMDFGSLYSSILVDKNNKEIGTEEKIKAHREGLLHRAFSIFVFNSKGELLLQQRSKDKYHSGGLWSNTVCSHPKIGESYDCNDDQKDHRHRRGIPHF